MAEKYSQGRLHGRVPIGWMDDRENSDGQFRGSEPKIGPDPKSVARERPPPSGALSCSGLIDTFFIVTAYLSCLLELSKLKSCERCMWKKNMWNCGVLCPSTFAWTSGVSPLFPEEKRKTPSTFLLHVAKIGKQNHEVQFNFDSQYVLRKHIASFCKVPIVFQ